MGWEAGSLYRINKDRTYLAVKLVWGEKEKENKYRTRVGLVFGGWLPGYIAFLS